MVSENIQVCVIVFSILLIYLFYRAKKTIVVPFNDNNWNVAGGYDDTREAARTMHDCNETVLLLLRHLKAKYYIGATDDEIVANRDDYERATSSEWYPVVVALLSGYNPEEFYENDPRYSSETSYTLNKGDRMFICMRDKKTYRIMDKRIIIFVMIHEAAHIANYNGWGHDERFWQVFKYLLREAEEANIYRSVDYKRYPINYCGLHVDYNPIFDSEVS